MKMKVGKSLWTPENYTHVQADHVIADLSTHLPFFSSTILFVEDLTCILTQTESPHNNINVLA